MKKFLHFVVDYWYIPVLLAAAILVWIITKGKALPPIGVLNNELAAIQAGSKAREYQSMLGAEKALEQVKKDHAFEISKLNAEQAAKAEELKNDPVELSKFLVRAARAAEHPTGGDA